MRVIAKNILALGVNGGIRILLGMVVQVLIARFLGAEALGKFAVMLAYVVIFQVVSQLGLSDLIVREVARHRDDASRYWWSTAPILVVGGMASWGIQTLVARLWGHPQDTYTMIVIAGASLVPYGIVVACEALARGLERMEIIPAVQTVAYLSYVLLVSLVIFLGWPVVTLAWSMVLLHVVGASLYVAYLTLSRTLRPLQVDVALTRSLLRQAPPFYGVPAGIIVPNRAAIIIIARILGEEASGIFNAAQLVVRALFFLSTPYADALYPALARLFVAGRDRFLRGVRLSVHYGLVVSGTLALVIALSAWWIVSLLFGLPEYARAVPLVQILAWQTVPFLLNSVFNVTEMAANRQTVMFLIALAKIVIFLMFVALAAWWGGLTGAAVGMVSGSMLTLALHTLATRRILAAWVLPGDVWRSALAIVLGIAALVMTRSGPTVLAVLFPFAVYAGALLLLGAVRYNELAQLARQIVGTNPLLPNTNTGNGEWRRRE